MSDQPNPIFGHFSNPAKIGNGIIVNSEKTQVVMNENKVYRSAQLNTPFSKTPEKFCYNYKVNIQGISGGWLYLGLSRELYNYNASCFYDIDFSFGFGLSCREICFESY